MTKTKLSKNGRKPKRKIVRYERIWPPPKKEVTNPQHFLIEEKGCEECRRYFGFATHRGGQYTAIEILQSGVRSIVGYWNDYQDTFRVLGFFSDRTTAEQAVQHILSET